MGNRIRLCARCSGYLTGFLLPMILKNVIRIPFFPSISFGLQFLFCITLILPLTLDWMTQSWGLRESNNRLRFVTGVFLGIAVFMFLSIDAPYKTIREFYLFSGLLIAVFGLIGKKWCSFSQCSL
jgi:uncharacterized membrane protein